MASDSNEGHSQQRIEGLRKSKERRTGWYCQCVGGSIEGWGDSASGLWRASASCGRTCGTALTLGQWKVERTRRRHSFSLTGMLRNFLSFADDASYGTYRCGGWCTFGYWAQFVCSLSSCKTLTGKDLVSLAKLGTERVSSSPCHSLLLLLVE